MDTNTNQSDTDELAGDLLVGKDAIKAFLVYLGMPEDTDPYYLKRAGHWPIGKTGGEAEASSPPSAALPATPKRSRHRSRPTPPEFRNAAVATRAAPRGALTARNPRRPVTLPSQRR